MSIVLSRAKYVPWPIGAARNPLPGSGRDFRASSTKRRKAMAALTLRDIVKVYGRQIAVRGVDLDIPDKALVVFVGPSGCGKSTILRMIAGLETISHGELRIDGRLVNDVPSRERGVAMVFQSYALYPHMTRARQSRVFAEARERCRRPSVERRIDHAVAVLELEPYLDRKPSQLSGGQRQRVAMGRALVREPAVFLFDEPLSNLDAKLRNQMRVEIKRLQRRLQTTTIYVTHDQVEAMTLADVMVVLKDGEVAQVGTPIDVFETPANRFVAGFIGTPQMNLFAGQLVRRDAQWRFENADLALPDRPEALRRSAAGRPCRPRRPARRGHRSRRPRHEAAQRFDARGRGESRRDARQ